jgi:hypothetical protein
MPTLTVYIASGGTTVNSEPNTGQAGTSQFGHMWYQVSPDGTSTNASSFGFAPDPTHNGSPFAPGQVYTNDTSNYSPNPSAGGAVTSYTVNISVTQYNTLLAFGQAGTAANGTETTFSGGGASFNNKYNGLANSCVDYTWTALSTVGISMPSHVPGTMLLPTWNSDAVDQAFKQFTTSGPQSSPTQLQYDSQGNLLQETTRDTGGNITSQATFTSGANSESAVAKNGAGVTVETQSASMDPVSGAFTIDAKGVNGSGSVINEQQISTTATGTTTATVTGTGASVELTGATVNFSGNAVSATVSGNGNTVTGGANSAIGINGNGDLVNANGDVVSVGANSSATINGNSNTVNEAANSGTYVAVSGQGLTVNGVSGSSRVDLVGAGTSATVNGSGSSVGICDNNQTLTTSNETVNFSAGGFSTGIHGSGDTINLVANSGAYLGVFGQNQVVNGDSGTSRVDLGGDGTSATVNGSGSSVGICANNQHLTASNETVNFSAGGFSTSVSGSSDTINLVGNSGAYLGVFGQNQTVNGDTGSSRVDLGGDGTSATVNGSGSSVGICANNQTLTTSGETVNFSAGGFSTSVHGSGDIINEAGNSGAYLAVYGQNQTVNGDTGSSRVDLGGDGTSATVNGSGSSVGICANNQHLTTSNETVNFSQNGFTTSVAGNSDVVNLGANSTLSVTGSSDVVAVFGSGDSVTASSTRFNMLYSGESLTLTGTSDVINGQNEHIYLTGSNETEIVNGGGNTFSAGGTNDRFIDNLPSGGSVVDVFNGGVERSYDYTGPNGTGTLDGTSAGGGGSGGYYYYYGFDRVHMRNTPTSRQAIDLIGRFDKTFGNDSAGGAPLSFESSLATDVAAAPLEAADTAAVPYTSRFEGGAWKKPVVTWSFAAADNSKFSGSIDSTYQATVAKAFETWAQASGVSLKQVASGQADIVVGWGDLDTNQTGVLGLTSLKTRDGTIASGVQVRLEDPSQMGLQRDASGQYVYADSGATLYQVALHEVGRAMGLGANNDPNSVMSFYSTNSNLGLDATDISGIQQLYQSKATGASAIGDPMMAASVNLLIQSAASLTESKQGLGVVRPIMTDDGMLKSLVMSQSRVDTMHRYQ